MTVDDDVIGKPMLTQEQAKQIASKVRKELAHLYGPRLRNVYLYGSCARGDIHEDSDVDIAIILDHIESTYREHDRVSQLGSDLSLDNNCLVNFLFATETEFNNRKYAVLRAIHREGVSA